MAVYVIEVFLCRMGDGSGLSYASDDNHFPCQQYRLFSAILGPLVHLHPN